MMFRQEMFGYSKEDVDAYLKKTLERLEKYEKILDDKRKTITALENQLKNSDTNEKIIEQAKSNADAIVFKAVEEANDLELRIHNAVLQELEK